MAQQQAVPPSYRIAGSPLPDGVVPPCFPLASGLAPQQPGADDAPSQASRRRADLRQDRTTTGLILPFPSSNFYPYYDPCFVHFVTQHFRVRQQHHRNWRLQRDEQGYDVVVELMGDVANPMGGMWRLLGGRKLWVSCKRVNPSTASGEFARRAQTVCKELRASASAAGHRMYAGVVISRDELPAHSTTLRELWDSLCRTHAPLSGTKTLTHGRYTALFGPHPAVQPSNLASLRPGYALQVFGALSKQEYKRIEGIMQRAVDGLKMARDANFIPNPSRTDAWVLAIDIPRWVSAATVAHLAAKQFAAGKFHDLSAVLLTRSLNAVSLSPPPTAVLTQEVYLVENARGSISLKTFLDDTHLQPRVSGEYLEAPAVLIVPDSQPPFASPEGYVYQEYGYQGAQSWPTPPDILLPQLRVPYGYEAAPTLPVLDRMPAPRDAMPVSGHPADLPLVPAAVGQ